MPQPPDYTTTLDVLDVGGSFDGGESPDDVWGRLNTAWVVYALFMASANAYVALYFSTETWVNFKLWGYAFPVLFILGQGVYISRHLGDEPAPKAADPKSR